MRGTAVIITALSALDAVLTLRYLQRFPEGEANPIMAAAIAAMDPCAWTLAKVATTGAGCVLLAHYKCVRTLRAFLVIYVALTAWHVFLAVR